MKRAVITLVAGVLVLGSAAGAAAQAPAGPTVSFGGQMRVFGFVRDNVTDFRNSQDNGTFRDSDSFWFQRFRLFVNIESADKKARAVWATEVGDITWGNGGGASGGEYGGTGQTAPGVVNVAAAGDPAQNRPVTAAGGGNRVGNSSGGGLGGDGVNVETKLLYIWLDTGAYAPGTSVLLGLHNIVFMVTPWGGLMDDDGAGVQLNWKADPVDLQLYTVKVSEGNLANADDVDMYVARLGFNATKDLRLTVEGMVVDQRNLAQTDFGDTFWVGATVGAKLGTVSLDGAAVYGQRAQAAAAGTGASNFDEEGFGGFLMARVPVGPIQVVGIGWYTTGDDNRGPGSANNGPLAADSDKLPLPIGGAGYGGAGGYWIAETLFGNATIGAPGVGQRHYADITGTYGFGGSATYALTPAVSIGGGAAYVGATDAAGPWGDWAITVDGGLIWRFNPNVTITPVAGVVFPDEGDEAWQLAFRTQFAF